jgi:hypothetical protein
MQMQMQPQMQPQQQQQQPSNGHDGHGICMTRRFKAPRFRHERIHLLLLRLHGLILWRSVEAVMSSSSPFGLTAPSQVQQQQPQMQMQMQPQMQPQQHDGHGICMTRRLKAPWFRHERVHSLLLGLHGLIPFDQAPPQPQGGLASQTYPNPNVPQTNPFFNTAPQKRT